MDFKITSKYKPTGDQPQAIRQLTEGVLEGDPAQVLLGVTGSGKTFTVANVIANVGKPTLILSHNKTLAAQLYQEMKGFFPENAVEYYVSYYDYYQPEAYLPTTDTYIEKELDAYLERYFREVCTEYLLILNQMGQLPFTIKRVGTWIGKTGRIDIVAQSEDRRSIIGFCNWDKPMMTMDMCENMAMAMEQARLTSDDYYLFSATDFEPVLQSYVVRDPRFKLINMNEL